jgi:hypothetical protein
MVVINFSKNFVEQECCACGVIHFIPSDLDRNLRESKKNFWCPNGHPQSYLKSEAQILREKNALLESRVDIKDQQIIDRDSTIGKLERKVKHLSSKKKSK